MTTMNASKLKEVETALAQSGAELQQESPETYAKLQRVVAALKRVAPGKPYPDEVKRLTMELVTASFDAQLAHYTAEHAEVKKQAAATKDPAVEKAALALGELVSFLTEAKAAGMPPSDKAAAALEARVPTLQKLLAEASEAAARSTANIPMRAVQGPITSSSGVALKAVQPPPRAAAVGEAMASLTRPSAPSASPRPSSPPAGGSGKAGSGKKTKR